MDTGLAAFRQSRLASPPRAQPVGHSTHTWGFDPAGAGARSVSAASSMASDSWWRAPDRCTAAGAVQFDRCARGWDAVEPGRVVLEGISAIGEEHMAVDVEREVGAKSLDAGDDAGLGP